VRECTLQFREAHIKTFVPDEFAFLMDRRNSAANNILTKLYTC